VYYLNLSSKIIMVEVESDEVLREFQLDTSCDLILISRGRLFVFLHYKYYILDSKTFSVTTEIQMDCLNASVNKQQIAVAGKSEILLKNFISTKITYPNFEILETSNLAVLNALIPIILTGSVFVGVVEKVLDYEGRMVGDMSQSLLVANLYGKPITCKLIELAMRVRDVKGVGGIAVAISYSLKQNSDVIVCVCDLET
jgi:hypothetical protein